MLRLVKEQGGAVDGLWELGEAEGSGDLFWSARTVFITAQSHAQHAERILMFDKPQLLNERAEVVVFGTGVPHMLPGQFFCFKERV